MNATHVRIGLVFSMLLLPSCNGAAAGISSGLPQDRPADQLTDAQVEQLCHAIDDYLFAIYPVSEEHRLTCTTSALGRTFDETDCQEDVRVCLMADFPGRAHINCESATSAGCTATVNQLETCIEERYDALDQRVSEVQCSAAGDVQELNRLSTAVPLPASCTSLSAICRTEIGI